MNTPCGKQLNQILKEKAYFVYYREGKLVYKTDSGFVFHVPVSECDQAKFSNEDRAMFFLRWIRPVYTKLLLEMNTRTDKPVEVKPPEPKNPMSEPVDEFEKLEGLS